MEAKVSVNNVDKHHIQQLLSSKTVFKGFLFRVQFELKDEVK